jgi:hypothetical protein
MFEKKLEPPLDRRFLVSTPGLSVPSSLSSKLVSLRLSAFEGARLLPLHRLSRQASRRSTWLLLEAFEGGDFYPFSGFPVKLFR